MFGKKVKCSIPALPVDVKGLYSIYDNVSHEFSSPWLAKNDEIAIRTFQAQINSALKKAEEQEKSLGYNPFSPSDFSLYCVAEFDIANGNVKSALRAIDSF